MADGTAQGGEASAAAAAAWRILLIVGFAVIAGLNLPGHIPFDTLTALWEGRSHVRMSWGPRMYSALLGIFDAIAPGVGLFAAASMLLLFLAWGALPRLARRALRPRLELEDGRVQAAAEPGRRDRRPVPRGRHGAPGRGAADGMFVGADRRRAGDRGASWTLT